MRSRIISGRLGSVAQATLLALACAAPLSAHAIFSDDEARRAILELRQRLDQATEQRRGEQTRNTEQIEQLRRSLLDLNNQLEQTRSELARLRGENEQLARTLAELQRGQTDLKAGLDERMRQFEPQRAVVDGKDIQVRPDEKRDYEAALELFRKGDFPAAADAFAAFQRRYPGSGYNEAVLYWMGNALYGKRDYREAMTAFRSLVTASPQHLRAPEALLSIAMCQIELKDRTGARRTLDELIKAHPQSEAAAEAKERRAALR
ncbi:tol-pal system protein YbgF [Aquabacterium sp. A7-Y]|uniref:tol-pal system protein YbgF n=1 Tax=Aquabacterium sp. A7-Y TaxID=1349605 RepID=UPI00223D49C7|nr:tol-pal system protein YbgF [Aquabacterium sp. A7-Y]MCW7538311.1 tol-pal system protein YbgF [Aquabacterium sp. A7-Y]